MLRSNEINVGLVIFRLKPGVSAGELGQWSKLGQAMVGKIPGLTPNFRPCSHF